MANKLLASHGFGQAIRALGYLVAGLLLVAQLLVRTRLPGRRQRAGPPPPPIDMKTIVTDAPYLFAVAGIFMAMRASRRGRDDADMLPVALFAPICAQLCALTTLTFDVFSQLYALSNGVDPNLAFYSLSILNAGSVFGRVVPNFAADYSASSTMLTSLSSRSRPAEHDDRLHDRDGRALLRLARLRPLHRRGHRVELALRLLQCAHSPRRTALTRPGGAYVSLLAPVLFKVRSLLFALADDAVRPQRLRGWRTYWSVLRRCQLRRPRRIAGSWPTRVLAL